jgi:glutathione synthase/RimK-type ligase-like ATP-grasp enzyme
VRVHVVGGEAFATRIDSDVTDYRYATRMGGEARLSAVELPDATAERCVALAAGLGLEFVGIDLKITPDGEAYCFEVNPCPAFSYYEANTGQPIARAVARRLAS